MIFTRLKYFLYMFIIYIVETLNDFLCVCYFLFKFCCIFRVPWNCYHSISISIDLKQNCMTNVNFIEFQNKIQCVECTNIIPYGFLSCFFSVFCLCSKEFNLIFFFQLFGDINKWQKYTHTNEDQTVQWQWLNTPLLP